MSKRKLIHEPGSAVVSYQRALARYRKQLDETYSIPEAIKIRDKVYKLASEIMDYYLSVCADIGRIYGQAPEEFQTIAETNLIKSGVHHQSAKKHFRDCVAIYENSPKPPQNE